MQVRVIGSGGHGKVVVHSLQRMGCNVVAVYDDNEPRWGESLLQAPVIGPIERIADAPRMPTVIAIGDNASRRRLAQLLAVEWFTVIDPQAIVAPDVSIGPGSVILPGAIVQVGSRLGNHVIVNNGASIDHDCTLGDYVHAAPGVHLAGNVTIDEGAFLGTGAIAIPTMQVGAWSVVGAGAVVVTNVPPGVVAVGCPARVVRSICSAEQSANGRGP
jgi:sugar O-acyltransferase (sialic acid O-acetyltransferase NeuD family)